MAARVKRVVELTKADTRILVTVLEGDQVASCVEEKSKKYCEACQCNEGACNEWIEHLKSKGYQATEVGLKEMDVDESLPKFLEEREIGAEPSVAAEVEPIVVIEPEVSKDDIAAE
ncbi:hypothetical protein ES707_15675 [subsurface metagenome]